MNSQGILKNDEIKLYIEEMIKYRIAILTAEERIDIYMDELLNNGVDVDLDDLDSFITAEAEKQINAMPAGKRI